MTYFGKTTGSDVAHLAQFQYVSILLIWRAANKKFVNGQTKNRSVSGHDNKQVAPGITHPRLRFPVDEETIFVNLKEAVRLPVAGIFLLQTAQDVVISTRFRQRERGRQSKRVLCPFSAKHRSLVYSKWIFGRIKDDPPARSSFTHAHFLFVNRIIQRAVAQKAGGDIYISSSRVCPFVQQRRNERS